MAIRRDIGGATRERSIQVPGHPVRGFFMPLVLWSVR